MRVGLDIGATKVLGAVIGDGGTVAAQARQDTRPGPDGVLESVKTVLDLLAADLDGALPPFIGIGIPGLVDRQRGTVSHAVNLGLGGEWFPLADRLAERTGATVIVENDLNAATWGARVLSGSDDLAYVSLGTGLAAGFVLDGVLRRGAHGAAGEIGYLPLSVDPFDPRHRIHGGLEDEIGAAGIVSAYNAGRAGDDPELEAVHEVFELAAQGNAAARSVVDLVAARLGTAIATVCAILDPELVVLGGGIGSSPLLLSPVRGAAASLVPITARIETSLLGDRAALRGAIAVALNTARATLLSAGAATPPRSQPVRVAPRRS